MAIEFEKRLVAFVDILGWSKAVETQPAELLFNVLLPLRQRAETWNEARRKELVVEHGVNVNPLHLMVQFAFFSDCFVYSMPTSMGGRIYNAVADVVLHMLKQGFALRGGIAAGPLFHEDQIVFGPSLVSAYRLESAEAKFARVMVDESAIQEIGIEQHDGIMQDHLGNWIVDPFPWVANHNDMHSMLKQFFSPDEIAEVVKRNIASLKNQPRKRDIWRFQAEVCARSLEKYGEATADWVSQFKRMAAID